MRWVFICRTVEIRSLSRYVTKTLESDRFVDLEVGKLWLCNFQADICTLDIFPNKNERPLRMVRVQINAQAVTMLSLISGNVFALS